MSGTLVEAKAELGHVQARIDEHKRTECTLCRLAKGKRCENLRRLDAHAKDLREQIKTWFDPPPGSAQLDLDLGLES